MPKHLNNKYIPTEEGTEKCIVGASENVQLFKITDKLIAKTK